MRITLLAILLLSGCAAVDQYASPQLTCEQQEAINAWTEDCLRWAHQRDADLVIKEKAADEAREKTAAKLRVQQAIESRNAERLEASAIKRDEAAGFKAMSFEDFYLDAPRMKGDKVAIRGFYIDTGERLIRDPMSAARYVSTGESAKGTQIPLLTDNASREARARFLRCNSVNAPLGCGLVVRGHVESLTLKNRLGVQWNEFGIVVESIRP